MKHLVSIGIGALFVAACGGAQKTQDNAMVGNTVAMDEQPVAASAGADEGGTGTAMALDEANKSANPCGGTGTALALGPPAAPTTWTTDNDTIRGVVMANLVPIKSCYEKRLQIDPTASGTTTATFTITPDGAVTASTASGFDPDVDSCVAQAIETQMKFPPTPARGHIQVSYPFVFTP